MSDWLHYGAVDAERPYNANLEGHAEEQNLVMHVIPAGEDLCPYRTHCFVQGSLGRFQPTMALHNAFLKVLRPQWISWTLALMPMGASSIAPITQIMASTSCVIQVMLKMPKKERTTLWRRRAMRNISTVSECAFASRQATCGRLVETAGLTSFSHLLGRVMHLIAIIVIARHQQNVFVLTFGVLVSSAGRALHCQEHRRQEGKPQSAEGSLWHTIPGSHDRIGKSRPTMLE